MVADEDIELQNDTRSFDVDKGNDYGTLTLFEFCITFNHA